MFPNIVRRISCSFSLRGLGSKLMSTQSTTTSLCSTILIHRYNPVFSVPSLISPKKINILDLPLTENHGIIDMPKTKLPVAEKRTHIVIEEPGEIIEKLAARMITIRRKKMKRHKLKKLRIKMKFLWAKLRQRREMAKEKAFQAELMCQIREAEKFNAAAYAREKIERANEVLLPKLWKGKRLPEFIIKELIAEKKKKLTRYLEDIERRKKRNVRFSGKSS